MLASTATLVAASVAITFLAGPIAAITGRAADSSFDTNLYRTAVLGTDWSNPSRTLDQGSLNDDSDALPNRRDHIEEPSAGVTTVPGPTPAEKTTGEEASR